MTEDGRFYFDDTPCPACRSRLLQKNNFRTLDCTVAGESAWILKCACERMIVGIILSRDSDGYLDDQPWTFLVFRSRFQCPRCHKEPRLGREIKSSGQTRGFFMMTLECNSCGAKTELLAAVRRLGRDPIPEESNQLDRLPDVAVERGAITVDEILEIHAIQSAADERLEPSYRELEQRRNTAGGQSIKALPISPATEEKS